MQRILVFTDVSGQHISPVFRGQSRMAAWPLMLGPIGYFETSETANLYRVTSQKNEIVTPRPKPEILGIGLFLTRSRGGIG